MACVRNGRVIINNQIREIYLEKGSGDFSFCFNRYYRLDKKEDIFSFVSRNSESGLHGKLCGLEVDLISSDGPLFSTNRYFPIQRNLDVLKDVEIIYQSPFFDDVANQLRISSITPFFAADRFQLKTTGEKIPSEAHQIKKFGDRVSVFEKPVNINNQKYFLEVKGVNLGHLPILLERPYATSGDCTGGLSEKRIRKSKDNLVLLNNKNFNSSILISAYLIPQFQFDGQKIGAYVRAVKSHPSLAHYSDTLHQVIKTMNFEKEEFFEYSLKKNAGDLFSIWLAGLAHNGPIHQQNIRINGITDFTSSELINKIGLAGILSDCASFFTSYRTLQQKLFPSCDLQESDFKTREIFVRELNKKFGFSLPYNSGTGFIGANVFLFLGEKGLAESDEKKYIDVFLDN